ncbi:MAG TPA: monooxygenase, partial [Bradyrhizobium sp.]|nr:monooxygenase [Bradyrhizobium sp.]
VYDALGPAYTLLRLDSDIEIAPLVEAMRDGGVPLEVVDLQTGDSQHLYDRKLILVRTDQHVAWRGDAVPESLQYLVDTLRGRTHLRPAVTQ